MTTLGPLCESLERRHPQEKCASKYVRGLFLSAFICFFSTLGKTLRCVVFGLRSLALGLRMVQAKDPRPKTQDRF
jgi:hypothetical protein